MAIWKQLYLELSHFLKLFSVLHTREQVQNNFHCSRWDTRALSTTGFLAFVRARSMWKIRSQKNYNLWRQKKGDIISNNCCKWYWLIRYRLWAHMEKSVHVEGDHRRFLVYCVISKQKGEAVLWLVINRNVLEWGALHSSEVLGSNLNPAKHLRPTVSTKLVSKTGDYVYAFLLLVYGFIMKLFKSFWFISQLNFHFTDLIKAITI